MASRFALALLISAALPAISQDPTRPQPPTGEPQRTGAERPEGPGPRPDGPPPGGPDKRDGRPDWHHGPPPKLGPDAEAERDRAMRELQKLTPEQRERIWKVVTAVLNLPEEKRIEFLSNEEERRKKIKDQIEQAIKDIGVPIPDDRKRAFFHKYFEGRRAIEEQLRKEADERRKVLIGEFQEQLKKDFATPENQKVIAPK